MVVTLEGQYLPDVSWRPVWFLMIPFWTGYELMHWSITFWDHSSRQRWIKRLQWSHFESWNLHAQRQLGELPYHRNVVYTLDVSIRWQWRNNRRQYRRQSFATSCILGLLEPPSIDTLLILDFAIDRMSLSEPVETFCTSTRTVEYSSSIWR